MRLRRRSPIKRVFRVASVYMMLVVMMFGVARLLPGRSHVVPVMSPARTQHAPVQSFVKWLTAIYPELPEASLRLGLPRFWYVEDIERTAVRSRSFWGMLGEFVTGVDPDDPTSLVRLHFPAGLGASVSYQTPVPYTPPVPQTPAAEAIVRVPLAAARPAAGSTDSPLVFVYHTHARETYLPEMASSKPLKPEDAHTDDLEISVVRVGRELVDALKELGVPALHSTEVHDREGRLGSYVRSEATLQSVIGRYPSIQILLDVHRDSQLRSHTTLLAQGHTMAKIMVVLGSDNQAWRQNYDFAVSLMNVLETEYAGISRGIFPKPGRFNQHYSPYALLLEFGGVENTLEEALRSARAVAYAIAAVVFAEHNP